MDAFGHHASPFAAFSASAVRRPGAPVLIGPASAELPYARDGFRIGYGALAGRVDAVRAGYAAAGYGAGARVALLLDSRPEFFVHWLALNALGVSIVPVNPDLRPDELSFQMARSRAALLVAAGDRTVQARGASLASAALVEADAVEGGAVVPPFAGTVAGQEGARDSECALLFTSGSTGTPKACILSNDYFMRMAAWYLNQGGAAAIAGEDEVNLTPLPMFHMNALGCSTVAMMVLGGAVVPLDRFHARRWWASVADSGATIVHCLGVIPAILLQLPPHEAETRHRARFAFAPAVDVRHRAMFEERYRLPVVDAWAMTETGGSACTTTAREPAGFPTRCIGRPAPGMEYRLVDDAGREVVAGQPGELLVRTAGADPRAGFFGGYLDEPDATEEAWRGGWFHTGDYVRADEDGLMYFFDRKKSIVRRSGENIAVLEVESALHRQPGVEGVAVTPVADELRGEEVFAFVVRPRGAGTVAGGDEAQARGVVEGCADVLAYHKLPGWVAFVDTLPLSATKKLARGEVKVLAAAAVAAGTAIDLRAFKGRMRTAARG